MIDKLVIIIINVYRKNINNISTQQQECFIIENKKLKKTIINLFLYYYDYIFIFCLTMFVICLKKKK